jgi:hypothetical protein
MSPHTGPAITSPADRIACLSDALDRWERLHRNCYGVYWRAIANDPWQLLECRDGNAALLRCHPAGADKLPDDCYPPGFLSEAQRADLQATEQRRAHWYREAETIVAAVEAHGDAVAVVLERAGLDSSPLHALILQREARWIAAVQHALRRLAARMAAGVAGPARLVIDRGTGTATLDGIPFPDQDDTALHVLQVIADRAPARVAGPTIIQATGCSRPDQELNKLHLTLLACVDRGRGRGGYLLVLPALPAEIQR